MRPVDLGMLLLLAAIWGASFLFIRVASLVLGPAVLMDLRVLIGGAALVPYALSTRRMPEWRRWRGYLLLGALSMAIPFTLIAYSELYLPASLAAILNATTPLFTAAVAAIWIGAPLTRAMLAGLPIGFIGVIALVGWSPVALTITVIVAALASLLAALFYALGGVYIKRYFPQTSPVAGTIGQQFGAAILLLPLALYELPQSHVSSKAIVSLLALALLSTSFGYILYLSLIHRVGPTRALSVTFLVPVFGLLWSVIFLGEHITVGTIAGMAIILGSVFLVTGVRLHPGQLRAVLLRATPEADVVVPEDHGRV